MVTVQLTPIKHPISLDHPSLKLSLISTHFESIECNDSGADSVEAHVNCPLAHLLQKPDVEILRKLLPVDTRLPVGAGGCLLSVQTNFFECGGLAIGVCFSHRIADAFTFISFMKSWADINAGVPLKRIVFRGPKIAELRAKAASESIPQPSRIEAVTALIWKCAMAASRSNHGFSRPSTLSHVVNLRKRIALPSSPENSMGNIYSLFFAETDAGEKELPVLVGLLRGSQEKLCEKLTELARADASSWVVEIKEKMKGLRGEKDVDLYIFSSWCEFPTYEADFRWGKPTWVTSTPPLIKNSIFLLDTRKGDGIEAWIPLSKQDMAFFERDENLLAFASLDPSAL
ncbi:hypothetical protein SLEP1_g50778 [Rubroshorea leprosula]|uniref:Uncharacterized protein n=1 Tax=Rubroshorea leprosula TaxID=152421 RepID=A0AAV5M151_9ROSI|nr:hypothetical protein SLEP1_g50778 [Rubroshorea leprosula]